MSAGVKLLIHVRDFFKQNPERWIKGTRVRKVSNGVEGYCLLGGLDCVECGPLPKGSQERALAIHDAQKLLVTAIRKTTGLQGDTIPSFNDRSTTTVNDAIMALNGAIDAPPVPA